MLDLKERAFVKKNNTILRKRYTLEPRVNGRSSDFIFPSFAIGCELHCLYCNIARHRPEGNPLDIFTNLNELIESTIVHFKSLDKKEPNQCDPVYWTYDIGESTDCLLPRHELTVNRIISELVEVGAKPTFATKLHQVNKLRDVPKNSARVRLSLMPQKLSSILEPGTSPITKRLEAIDKLIEKGYEVHVNFSPVVLYKGWEKDYRELMVLIKDSISSKALSQLKAEVIFLTHNETLHKLNKPYFSEAEDYLWVPELQELKTTKNGDSSVVRYKAFTIKKKGIEVFKKILKDYLPDCEIRYIF